MSLPFATVTSYSPRLRQYANALLIPVLPATQISAARTTKRGTTAINYAENDADEEEWEDSDGARRPTGLRSLKREEILPDRGPAGERLGTEIYAPTSVQPNFREWVIRRRAKAMREIQLTGHGLLPLNVVPIRIDIEVPAHQPLEPFPLPRNYLEIGINPGAPAYRKPDSAPPYRIKDFVLWNLHEPFITPEEFATTFVRELDLPNAPAMITAVCNQIRQQLEEYAGVAMHPIFQKTPTTAATNNTSSRPQYSPDALTPARTFPATPAQQDDVDRQNGVRTASQDTSSSENPFDTDDAYRCIVILDITLQNKLYTDKFEWSLLHDQGLADQFARVTCADLGLGPEWVNVISHGICEAVLKLKKEACESGGLVGIGGDGAEIDNQAANGKEAGWRYDPDGLGDEWEPRVLVLSKEDIERREGDRERQIRRLRRETARFSSTAGMSLEFTRQSTGGYFDLPDPDTPLGRGERNKRRRRARSNSPTSGTPGGRATPDIGAVAGYGGGGGTLTDLYEVLRFPKNKE
ncbi:Chromatin structure remodeling complex protein sfh1 [Emydomyces testavorans]|uniref:Chromatin structure remodeling complex protein sfh1 n=1 Tax=Emydomyces testavorans TaxID=2070801 RepID=A0AAF0DC55_9EURO|nr:Chromatin structure remodeling complex protein sfh1 [Emydomyces testavorans]